MSARLILALVLSLYAVHAKYTIRLYRTPMAATTLSTTNKDVHVTEGSEPKNLPLADEIYQVEVAIGEPRKLIDLLWHDPHGLPVTLCGSRDHGPALRQVKLPWCRCR